MHKLKGQIKEIKLPTMMSITLGCQQHNPQRGDPQRKAKCLKFHKSHDRITPMDPLEFPNHRLPHAIDNKLPQIRSPQCLQKLAKNSQDNATCQRVIPTFHMHLHTSLPLPGKNNSTSRIKYMSLQTNDWTRICCRLCS